MAQTSLGYGSASCLTVLCKNVDTVAIAKGDAVRLVAATSAAPNGDKTLHVAKYAPSGPVAVDSGTIFGIAMSDAAIPTSGDPGFYLQVCIMGVCEANVIGSLAAEIPLMPSASVLGQLAAHVTNASNYHVVGITLEASVTGVLTLIWFERSAFTIYGTLGDTSDYLGRAIDASAP